MNRFYSPRAIVTTTSPIDGTPESVECYADEIDDVVKAAFATGRMLSRVEPFWSQADEEAECAADEARDVELVFG